ncbi:MAG: hypothetical protein CMD39_01500 [Gammaproteobacteria bacterium]|jgi:cytochrome c biogenesis protein CcdA|nr:hypothetical protein [Gammaproteobacteria bacterium]|tara:strand:- start:5502 stop:5702 length:201 start_codon:yes stop_codon:yes gene_type:complete
MAGVTLVALTFSAVLAVATAEERVASRLKARAPAIKKFSGYLVMLVGVWMLALAIFADWFAKVFTV